MNIEILEILNENLTPEQQAEMINVFYEQLVSLQNDVSFLSKVCVFLFIFVVLFLVYALVDLFVSDAGEDILKSHKESIENLSKRVKELEDNNS